MALIFQAENEYHDTLKKAVKEAEGYTDDCKKKQRIHIKEMDRKWEHFEKTEADKLKKSITEAEKKMEKETAQMKARLKLLQEKKANLISERLKEEVLSLYGNH